MNSKRKPIAEAFSPGEYLQDELDARGWSMRGLAERMGGSPDEININHCAIEMLILAEDKRVLLGDDFAQDLANALGTSKEVWLNLDKTWRESAPPKEAE